MGAAPPGGQQSPDLLRGREAPAKPPARVGVFSNKCHVSWGTRRGQELGCVRCRGPGAERGCAEGTPESPPAHVEERLGGCWELRAPGPGESWSQQSKGGHPFEGPPPLPQGHTGSSSTGSEAGHSEVKPGAASTSPRASVAQPLLDVLRGHGPHRPSPALPLSCSSAPGPGSWPQGGRRSMRCGPGRRTLWWPRARRTAGRGAGGRLASGRLLGLL